MRLRKKQWAKPELEKDPKVIFNPQDYPGKWHECFGNHNPIHLELGCGRGRFISRLAEMNQEINYIAVDLYDELLVYVLRKANELNLNNLRIIPMNIKNLAGIFEQGEIERLYLNFSTPWPSRRHHRRRLTYPDFLKMYQKVLKKGSEIWFKTDDEPLFKDSLGYFSLTGFREQYKTYDLHAGGCSEGVMTEYEEKFHNRGVKIKFAVFRN